MSKVKMGDYKLSTDEHPIVKIGLGMTRINNETIFPQQIQVEISVTDGESCRHVWVDIEDLVKAYEEQEGYQL